MSSRTLLACVCFCLLIASPSLAQPRIGGLGSVLIFPVFKGTGNTTTLVTVTNTNQSEVLCGNGFREGDVEVRFTYVDAGTCLQMDRQESLSPADTITVSPSQHIPGLGEGYLVIEALDPETFLPIDFDFLLGSAQILDTSAQTKFTYLAYGFEAPSNQGAFGSDSCGRDFVDVPASGHFGTIDFNGAEYDFFPDSILLDHFGGEGSPPSVPAATFSNRLWLMTTGGAAPEAFNLLGWNNNEVRFSSVSQSSCASDTTLGSISLSTNQSILSTGGDPGELFGIASGWLTLTSNNPSVGILGVFSQTISVGPRVHRSGRTLQVSGTRTVSLGRP